MLTFSFSGAHSRFTDSTVPLLWNTLLPEFGVDYIYHLGEGGTIPGLRGILIEGMEGEPVSPGRYARFWADARDLPRPPRAADWIELGCQVTYDVESVDAQLYNISRLVIKRTGQSWQTV